MTYVFGQAFDAFAQLSLTPNPPQSAKTAFLHNTALELFDLAVDSFVLGSLTSSLWIWTGGPSEKRYTSYEQAYDLVR
jgi:hypothetical protein